MTELATWQVATERSAWSESTDAIIVLDLQESMYFSLKGVAAMLWSRLAAGPATLADLVAAVTAEYDVDEESARRDALEFLDDLTGRRLVKTVSGTST